jgi:phage shock protein A
MTGFICTHCNMLLPSQDTHHDLQSCSAYLKQRSEKAEKRIVELEVALDTSHRVHDRLLTDYKKQRGHIAELEIELANQADNYLALGIRSGDAIFALEDKAKNLEAQLKTKTQVVDSLRITETQMIAKIQRLEAKIEGLEQQVSFLGEDSWADE